MTNDDWKTLFALPFSLVIRTQIVLPVWFCNPHHITVFEFKKTNNLYEENNYGVLLIYVFNWHILLQIGTCYIIREMNGYFYSIHKLFSYKWLQLSSKHIIKGWFPNIVIAIHVQTVQIMGCGSSNLLAISIRLHRRSEWFEGSLHCSLDYSLASTLVSKLHLKESVIVLLLFGWQLSCNVIVCKLCKCIVLFYFVNQCSHP